MIIVCNRLFIDTAKKDQFESRFVDRPRLVENQPGYIGTHLLRPTTEGDPYIIMTTWESREAFERWRTSPTFKEGHKGKKSLPNNIQQKDNKLEIFEVFGN